MQNITIGRCESDPQAQGVIRPGDDSWQLVIDADGFPILYVRTTLREEDGTESPGMLCIDDVLPEGMSTKDLMLSHFEGTVSPEDEAKGMQEHLARIEAAGRPCPRL